MIGVFDLEAEEKTDSLKGVEPFVDVVPQEDVFVAFHFVFVGEPEFLKNLQKVVKSAIDASKNFNRGPDAQQTAFFHDNFGCFLAESDDFIFFEGEQR